MSEARRARERARSAGETPSSLLRHHTYNLGEDQTVVHEDVERHRRSDVVVRVRCDHRRVLRVVDHARRKVVPRAHVRDSALRVADAVRLHDHRARQEAVCELFFAVHNVQLKLLEVAVGRRARERARERESESAPQKQMEGVSHSGAREGGGAGR